MDGGSLATKNSGTLATDLPLPVFKWSCAISGAGVWSRENICSMLSTVSSVSSETTVVVRMATQPTWLPWESSDGSLTQMTDVAAARSNKSEGHVSRGPHAVCVCVERPRGGG